MPRSVNRPERYGALRTVRGSADRASPSLTIEAGRFADTKVPQWACATGKTPGRIDGLGVEVRANRPATRRADSVERAEILLPRLDVDDVNPEPVPDRFGRSMRTRREMLGGSVDSRFSSLRSPFHDRATQRRWPPAGLRRIAQPRRARQRPCSSDERVSDST